MIDVLNRMMCTGMPESIELPEILLTRGSIFAMSDLFNQAATDGIAKHSQMYLIKNNFKIKLIAALIDTRVT